MKSRYTKTQIKNAISYWKNLLNEAEEDTSRRGGDEEKPEDKKEEKPVAGKNNKKDKKDKKEEKSEEKPENKPEDKKEEKKDGGAVTKDDVKKTEAAVSSDGTNTDNPKAAREEAQNVGTFDLGARLARIHNMAVKKTRKAVGKFLNSSKIGNETSVRVTNSKIDPRRHTFNGKDGDEMIITISVSIDAANVKGYRKFLAKIFHESGRHAFAYRYERLNEGLFSTAFGALTAAAKAGKEGFDKSVQNANDEFRKRIGVVGLQTYLNSFCGVNSHLADNVKTIEPEASSITNDNGNARYEYSCKVTIAI